MRPVRSPDRRWTFLTNHTRLLVAVARDPNVLVRQVATALGITERAVQGIVTDLEARGYLTRTRIGRRVGDLLTLFTPSTPGIDQLEQPPTMRMAQAAAASIHRSPPPGTGVGPAQEPAAR